jgi:5'-methylthioadenosine phosphorylase
MQAGESVPGAIGVLGGSGLYDLDGLEDLRQMAVTTPFGPPSAPPMVGRFADVTVVFIPRHGRGHRLLPSEINYRANVCALKDLGVTQVIALSAVGSMREDIHPGDFVLVDQFIDRTSRRLSTFFGEGCAGHVGFAEPVCPELLAILGRGAEEAGVARSPRTVHKGGAYVCIEGPQFSSLAESRLYREAGAAVIGMTGVTEAKLCREAELCFALVALATDYDCWHPHEASVSARAVVEVLLANVAASKQLLRGSLPHLPTPRRCPCGSAARDAILTANDAITPEARERLRGLFGRYIG